ncbi:hypothetical protein [Paraburkholderia lycopersici]|uniref:Uncharacterized protein n=1 Tax=Paraburkholderia lycopersici TaxID=416944 RepID=A0A1G6HDR0_9BURK|nr:hypothetical protein [Paraburkholderia lycopersici]SDB92228.1 hypothetical protein SAMN05421548_102199 [Paraburkholderia lycopersici]
MKCVILSSVFAVTALAAATTAMAQTSAGDSNSKRDCAIGYVTGVAGSPSSVREYLATPERDRIRYLKDNEIQCKIADDDSHASGCTGVTLLKDEKVSVYDDSDAATTSIVVRVELDRGTYPVIIVAPKNEVTCDQ